LDIANLRITPSPSKKVAAAFRADAQRTHLYTPRAAPSFKGKLRRFQY